MATSSISTCQSHWLRRGLGPSMVASSSLSYRSSSLSYRCMLSSVSVDAGAGAVGTSWILHHSLHHPLPHLRPLPHPHRSRACHPLRFPRGPYHLSSKAQPRL